MQRKRAYPYLGKADTWFGMWLTLYAGHIYRHHTFIAHQQHLNTHCSEYLFRRVEDRTVVVKDASGSTDITVDSIHTWPEIQGQAIYRRQLDKLEPRLDMYVKDIASLAVHYFPGTTNRGLPFCPESLIHTMVSYSHEDLIGDNGEPTGTWLIPMDSLSRKDIDVSDRSEYSKLSGWPEQRIRFPKWEDWVQPTNGLVRYVTGRSPSRYGKRLSLEKVAIDLIADPIERHAAKLTYEHLWSEMKILQSAFGILGTKRTTPPEVPPVP